MKGHIAWLQDSGQRVQTKDGREIEVWNFNCDDADNAAWSEWAKHFREHYCLDSMIDAMKAGTEYEASRGDYLRNLVFPDANNKPGPSIRSGDFAEILISDLLEYQSGYLVPRTRYANKSVRNESAKGTDVVGMRFMLESEAPSPEDELITCETKAQISGGRALPRLQNAVDDSVKDQVRLAATLNAAKQRLILQGSSKDALRIQRFQNETDRPYIKRSSAAAVFDSAVFDSDLMAETVCGGYESGDIRLIVLHAADLKRIVNTLYELAAYEA